MSSFLSLACPSPKILAIVGDWVFYIFSCLSNELFILRFTDVAEFYDNHKPEDEKDVRQRKLFLWKKNDGTMSLNFNNIIVFLIVSWFPAKEELYSRCKTHY